MSKTSKNARRPGTPVGGAMTVMGHMRILTPLGGGTGAYVFNLANGKTPRVEVGSEQWTALLSELAGAGHAEQLREELDDLAAANPAGRWARAKADLVDAGVL